MFPLYERFASEASKQWAKFMDEKILEYFTKVHGRSTMEDILEFAGCHKCEIIQTIMPLGELHYTFYVNNRPQFNMMMNQRYEAGVMKLTFSTDLERVIADSKTMTESAKYQCPHCGEEFDDGPVEKVRTHDWPRPCRQVCPGSGHSPRSMDSTDPLWMDESPLVTNLRKFREWAIGQSFDEISKEASKNGFIVRPVNIDGNRIVGLANYDPNRFNVRVENGIITEVTGIG